jgi:hypothetical protein
MYFPLFIFILYVPRNILILSVYIIGSDLSTKVQTYTKPYEVFDPKPT